MRYDIVIIGGGLVGSSFALAIAKNNPHYKIAIIEKNQPDFTNNNVGYDNKIYAISPTNLKHLANLGVEIDFSRCGSIEAMNVRGNQDSAIIFDKQDCNNQFLARIVEYRNILKSIANEISKTNIVLIYDQIEDIVEQEDLISISLVNDMIETKWVIAADGANSYVRNKFDFIVEEIPYYQSGLVANFSTEINHDNVAHQWFLGDGILAYLPLTDNKISIVWSTDRANQLLKLSNQELAHEVAVASNFELGKLETITQSAAFPLKMRLVNKFFHNNIILIGDAAHTIHPLAGQGVNLGFGDAWELAKLFNSKLNKVDRVDLIKYNSIRMAEVRKMQMTCHLLHRIFHNRNYVISKICNLGLNLVNNFKLIKSSLINSAINY